ncbi:ArsR/SmtB family transcription factor [Vulgatibacter sp.]|uniref:ArsR/SmtB family transcription factor n=1 Tax=Vulgatibacter sp. TaxID=1971226 RepID=UPI0035668952
MIDPSPRLDAIFHALADPTRRAILAGLAEGERSVGEIAAPFAISLAAVSKHLKVLEAAGLIDRRWEGRTARCRLDAEALRTADEWLAHYRRFWTDRLDALERMLRDEARPPRRKR